jgi:tripartite-type tricarboxylate transporter receptor subunit TctC
MVLLTHPNSGFNSLKDLQDFAKSHPSELSYSSGGSGGLTHLCMEVFLTNAKISAVHIPYKGSGPAIIDLLAGRVQLTFSTLPAAMQYIKTGRLKALAVASNSRSSMAPEIKTFKEQGLGNVAFGNWYGLIGPKNMPADIVQKISQSLSTSAKVGVNKNKLYDDGVEPIVNSGEQFAQFLTQERNQWSLVSKNIDFKRQD